MSLETQSITASDGKRRTGFRELGHVQEVRTPHNHHLPQNILQETSKLTIITVFLFYSIYFYCFFLCYFIFVELVRDLFCLLFDVRCSNGLGDKRRKLSVDERNFEKTVDKVNSY